MAESAAPPRDALFRSLHPGFVVREQAGDDGGMPTLTGHFAVFNRWTEIDSLFEGHFLERVAPGAFTKTFKENRSGIRVLFQHGRDPQIGDKPLGVPDDLAEDDTGGRYSVPLFDTAYNRELLPGLRAGAYGASFRFRVTREAFVRTPEPSDYNPQGLPERTIQEASVSEFGPVTFPAYAEATAGVRSLSDDFLIDALTRSPERLRELMRHLPAIAPLDDAGSTTSSGRRDEPGTQLRPLAPIRRNANRKAS
jgi:HK97 family phage prohead protease